MKQAAAATTPAAANEAVLHTFGSPPYGAYVYGGVNRDPEGNFYGTTANGGTSGEGVVFKVDTSGRGTVLYSFTGGADGGYPQYGLVRDTAGNVYWDH